MTKIFKSFPNQYEINMNKLKSIKSIETNYQYLEKFYEEIL